MTDSLSLEGKIHFYYDRAFDDVKKEVFANWILEYLNADDPPQQTTELIEAYLTTKLGFDIGRSARTRKLFESSLDDLIVKKWVERRNIPIDQQSQNVYISTDAGKQRLSSLKKQSDELLEKCYQEFMLLLHRQLFRQNPQERPRRERFTSEGAEFRKQYLDASSNISEDEAIRQVENLLSPLNSIRDSFKQYIKLISDVIAETLIDSAIRTSVQFKNDYHIITKEEIGTLFSLDLIPDMQIRAKMARALDRITKRLSELNLSTPNLQYWFWLKAYELLFQKMWPDEDVQEQLIQYLDCIYVYLDTNILIAALSESDPLHSRSRQILNFLLKNGVKVFWLPITEYEFKGHLELSKGLVHLLERRHPREIYEVLDLSKPPSFVKSYFNSSLRSWRQYASDINENYERIKRRSQQNKFSQILTEDKEFTQFRDQYIEAFQMELQPGGSQVRHPALLRHDATVLATIYALRAKTPVDLVTNECAEARIAEKVFLGELFWIVSFDRALSGISGPNGGRAQQGSDFPLTLLYETILLFLDPYVVSKALRESGGYQSPVSYLPLANKDDLESILERARESSSLLRSVADYITHYNQEMLDRFSNSGIT